MNNRAIAYLVAAAFGGAAHPLASWYAGLLEAAPPLQQFTAEYARKIHKKVRLATTSESQRDLRCELAVAAALADRRSPLVYEPLAAAGRRGPDFLLSYKAHTDVYFEVSRLRPARTSARTLEDRLAAVLCGKLGQLTTGAANVLVLVSDDGALDADIVAATIQSLRRRAEAKDDAYFAFRGLEGARALHQTLPRLSGLLAVAPGAADDVLFLYPQARHAIPTDLAHAMSAWGLGAVIGPL